jgi:hypothetical protein
MFWLLYAMLCAASLLTQAEAADQFQAAQVRLDSVRAQVRVVVREQDHVTVRVHDEDDLQDSLKIGVADGVLVIRQTSSRSPGDVSVITMNSGPGTNRSVIRIGGTTTHVEGGAVAAGVALFKPPISIDLTVPPGTPLALREFRGRVEIGDLLAPLEFSGSGRVQVGAVSEVTVDARANCRAEIESVSELLKVNASGNSTVNVPTGNVNLLYAHLKGNSRLRYGGHAQLARLSVKDNARLFVASLDKRQQAHIEGNGRVKIGAR